MKNKKTKSFSLLFNFVTTIYNETDKFAKKNEKEESK